MLGYRELCIEMEYRHNLQFVINMEDSQDRQHENQADIYKRIKLLGTGSYGRAFLVQEKQTGQEWVIKQINLSDMAPEQQQAALKQAKILQMLDHPNIVRFRQVYRTAKMKLNIVMEYAGGGDLSQRIKSAKQNKIHFSETQILDWFVQICLAVRYIHSNKIIHRDLKAQNIFLTREGLIKLGDFGVAKVLQHTAAKARTVVGSPYYLSPEIIENKPYSLKTDIWSLGALLYQLCALQPPFKANNLQFLALKIVQGAPPPLPKMYSEGLRGLVRYMLQTKQSSRPSINQIFSQKIIFDTIKRLNDFSQKHSPSAPHTISDFSKMSTLKPPPNLLAFDAIENKSDIVKSNFGNNTNNEEEPQNIKAQTPQTNVKKGANHFFHRPTTGRKKIQANSANFDLADLIQIKPSVIEKHQKYQKPQIPLPPVPKIPSSAHNKQLSIDQKQPTTEPLIPSRKSSRKEPIPIPPSTGFSKKRSSFALGEIQKKQANNIKELKVEKLSTKKIETVCIKKQKNQKKPQIRKKTFGTVKKQTGEINLEVCSEQAKKKQPIQKKLEKKKPEKVIRKSEKPKKQKKSVSPDKEKQIMEQQKCNSEQDLTSNNESDDYFSNYYDQQFQSYSDDSQEDIELAFSVTNQNNFQKMLAELSKIKKIVQTGQDIETADDLGQSIPQLLNFSKQIREDDNQLDSNLSIQICPQQKTPQTIDLSCLQTHAELQLLRMKLQETFGIQNIIFAYHVIENKLDQYGLNFPEEEVIKYILEEQPSINELDLRKYFGHIVAIISRQKNLV